MRRLYIYPHRSVRSFPVSRLRALAAILTAVSVSLLVLYFASPLLEMHSRVCIYLLDLTRIPASPVTQIDVFAPLGPAPAADVPFPAPRAHPVRTGLVFAGCLAAMIVIHRRVPLGRNFVIFLMILLFAAAIVIVFNPSFYFDGRMYQQIWLRGEILVWILLPWVAALLFIVTLPSPAAGVGWVLLLQVYAIVWSAVRLAFCLGVLHFTGILFLPLLWFALGILLDLVYVLVFYSLALRVSMRGAGTWRTP